MGSFTKIFVCLNFNILCILSLIHFAYFRWRQEPPNFRRFIFFALKIRTVALCSTTALLCPWPWSGCTLGCRVQAHPPHWRTNPLCIWQAKQSNANLALLLENCYWLWKLRSADIEAPTVQDARNRRIFGGLFFLPRRFEQLRFAQPQLCCVHDLGQAARSSSVCKPTRLTDGRIPYATPGERSREIVNISLKCAKDIRLFTARKIFTSITNTHYDTLKYIQKRLWIIYK